MPASSTIQLPNGSLSPDLRHELTLARSRFKTIRKAAAVATFNAWGTGLMAALTAPFALFSAAGFVLAVGLAVVAWNEFRGRRRLLALDASAPALLGWNQLGLLALVVVYSLWMLVAGMGSFATALQAQPELEAALGPLDEFEGLYRLIVLAFYGAVIAFSAVFQGLNALYYFTRRKHLDAYLRETPAWVQDVERTMSAE